jgi:serine/threonine-protein kinase HipA
MADVSVLDVLLHGEKIGTLAHVGGDRTLFAFTDAYIADPLRPVLSLSFRDALGELITDFRTFQTRLPPWFSNLLPEGHLRTYLAERAGVKTDREFFLLWVLGRDLPGAVTVVPVDGEAWPPGSGEEGRRSEKERRRNALRFSLGGVQLKFSAVAESRGRLTIPASGVGGGWIVKLPAREFEGVPENEFSMLTLARHVGIEVPPVELVAVASIGHLPQELALHGGQALAIRRFDRLDDGTAVHIEDFAQVFGVYPAEKYGKASIRNIAQVIAAQGSDADIAELVRRVVFNALIGNGDMHVKNWSLIYRDRRTAALAPAYDFVSTIAYIPQDQTFALKFSRTRRYDELDRDELSHLAGKARLPERLVLSTAADTVERFREAWRQHKSHLPLAQSVSDAVERQLKLIPLARG